MGGWPVRCAIAFAATAAVVAVIVGCGVEATGAGVPTAPGTAAAGSTGGSDNTSSGGRTSAGAVPPSVGYSGQRLTQIRSASQCVRTHGVPNYQDAVLTADGHVYTDSRSIQDAVNRDPELERVLRQACADLFTAAGFAPNDESPAPPALVEAGVRAARCLRANGMTAVRDPDSSSPFTPGHGFGLTDDQMPDGGRLGKADPTVQRAFQACRTLLDAEIRASTLAELAHD